MKTEGKGEGDFIVLAIAENEKFNRSTEINIA